MIVIQNPFEAKDMGIDCMASECKNPSIYFAWDIHRPKLMGEVKFPVYICRYHEYLGKNNGGE